MHITKYNLFFCLLIFCISSAFAQGDLSIKETLELMNTENTIAVVGTVSSDSDAVIAINKNLFANKLKSYAQLDEMNIPEDPDRIDDIIHTKNIILIGGPCANTKFWKLFSDETCEEWAYGRGEALIKAVKKGDQHVLLISGTIREDTFAITDKLIHSPQLEMFRQTHAVLTSEVNLEYEPVCGVLGIGKCKGLVLGYDLELKGDGKIILAELQEISEDRTTVKVLFDGLQYTVKRGESVEVQGVNLAFDSVSFDYALAKPSMANFLTSETLETEYGAFVTPQEKGSSNIEYGLYFMRFLPENTVVKFELQSIATDDSNAKVIVEGEPLQIKEGDSFTAENVEFTVKELSFQKGMVFFEFKRIN